MSVLRSLELNVGSVKNTRRENTNRQEVSRLVEIFREVKRKLAALNVANGAKISLKLKASLDRQRKVEQSIIKHLRHLTEAAEGVNVWPPLVPVERMVECFTGTLIGLCSDINPDQPRDFAANVELAFENTVIPALAWGLIIRINQEPVDLREAIRVKLVTRFQSECPANIDEVVLGGEAHQKVNIAYLRLAEAWFKLIGEKPYALSNEVRRKLRSSLANRLGGAFEELEVALWHELGKFYISLGAGTDRARIIAQAGGTAGFLRERLALFEAARAPAIHQFRLMTEQNLAEAIKHPLVVEQAKPSSPEQAGLEACGAAFWLARACFDQHGEEKPYVNEASERALLLLLRAAILLHNQPEQVTVCLRFAAGFATNPRYHRSALVLKSQQEVVALYAQNTYARKSLVEQFEGRIAWQNFRAEKKSEKSSTLRCYMTALKNCDDGKQGLDAEGPIHFFPELVVLLGRDTKQGKRAEPVLRTVDFITQRNYGIYFDIDREERLIEAGLSQFCNWKGQSSDTANTTNEEDEANLSSDLSNRYEVELRTLIQRIKRSD